MTTPLPEIYLVRHGQTEWSLNGRHTGHTDIPLTPAGEEGARVAGRRLAGLTFSRVFCSPSLRARRTCELAGFASVMQVDPDLAEVDYGQYEGLITSEIHNLDPNWQALQDDNPGGESVADITARADRVIARLRQGADKPLVFSSGHFLRALAARWLGLPISGGLWFVLGTASVSILGYEHSLDHPAILLWNEQPK